jgi:hypothetical protein
MPIIKELHYFDRLFDWPPLIKLQEQVAAGAAPRDLKGKNRFRAPDAGDLAFIAASVRLRGAPIDLAGYGALFPCDGMLSGDVTPAYGGLESELVADLARSFPRLKLLFLWRDPVDRAWSQLNMMIRQGRLEDLDPGDPAAILAWLDQPEVASRSYPSQIWRKWADRFGSRLHVTALDDIAHRPGKARRRILKFLGADPQLGAGLDPGQNRKAGAARLALTAPVRAALETRFSAEREACLRLLGPLSGA